MGYLPLALIFWLFHNYLDPASLYSIFIALLYINSALTFFYVGKRLLNSIGGGFIVAVLFLIDISGNREGGWFYVFKVGVWLHLFSTIIFLLGIYLLHKIVKAGFFKVGLVPLLWGISLLIHPMSLFTIAIFVVSIIFSLLLIDQFSKETLKKSSLVVIIASLSYLIAAFWYLNLYYYKGEMVEKGSLGIDLQKFGELIYYGSIYEKVPPVFFILFMLSIFFVLKEKNWFFLSFYIFVIINISLSLIPLEVILNFISSSFKYLLYKRFIMNSKPFFYLLTAYSILKSIPLLKEREIIRVILKKTKYMIFITSLFTLFFISSLYYWYKLDRQTSPIPTIEQSVIEKIKYLSSIINGDNSFYFRVGLDRDVPFLFGVYIKKPIVVFKKEPVFNFKYYNISFNLLSLKRFSVKYIISSKSLNYDFLNLLKDLDEFKLYEVIEFKPAPKYYGSCTNIKLTRWEDNIREFMVDSSQNRCYIVLSHAYSPKWKAYLNRTEIPINRYLIGNISVAKVDVPKGKGKLLIRYESPIIIQLSFYMALIIVFSIIILEIGLKLSRKKALIST